MTRIRFRSIVCFCVGRSIEVFLPENKVASFVDSSLSYFKSLLLVVLYDGSSVNYELDSDQLAT